MSEPLKVKCPRCGAEWSIIVKAMGIVKTQYDFRCHSCKYDFSHVYKRGKLKVIEYNIENRGCRFGSIAI